MLHDVVGGRAENVFRGIGLVFGDAGRADVVLEELHRVGDLLHQARERRAHQRHPQTSEQQQQRPGGAHDRIGVRRDQFVDPQQRPVGAPMAAADRCRRRRYPFFRSAGSPAPVRNPAVAADSPRTGWWTAASANTARGAARTMADCGWGACGSRPPGLGRMIVRSHPAEGICRFVLVAHRRSSRIAQSSSSSSGQSPEKCMPIDAASLNSGHSGDLRSR